MNTALVIIMLLAFCLCCFLSYLFGTGKEGRDRVRKYKEQQAKQPKAIFTNKKG